MGPQQLPLRLYSHSCVGLEDRVLVAGGFNDGIERNEVFFINLVSKSLTESQNTMKAKRRVFVLALIMGNLYAVGGYLRGNSTGTQLARIEEASNTEDPVWTLT